MVREEYGDEDELSFEISMDDEDISQEDSSEELDLFGAEEEPSDSSNVDLSGLITSEELNLFDDEDDDDSDEDDEDEDMDIEESEDDLLLEQPEILQLTSPEVEEAVNSQLAIKRRNIQQIVKTARTNIIQLNKQTITAVEEQLNRSSAVASMNEDFKQTRKRMDEMLPSFMNAKEGYDAAKAISETLSEVPDITVEILSNRVFEKVIDDSTKDTVVNRKLFYDFIEDYLYQRERQYDIVSRNTAMAQLLNSEFTDRMLEMSGPIRDENNLFLNATDGEIVQGIGIGVGDFEFVCGKCSCKSERYGLPITGVLNADVPSICVYPMICDTCGAVNVIPSKKLNSIKKVVNDKLVAMSTKSKELNMYYPSVKELREVCGDDMIYTKDESGAISEDKRPDLDWDKLCREYMENLRVLHESKKTNVDAIGIKGLAKILANLGNDYEILKEKALASLLTYLNNSSLRILAYSYKQVLEIPAYYEPKKDKYKVLIAQAIASNSYKESTGEVNDEQFEIDYKKYLEFIKEYEKRRKDYIQVMDVRARILSNIAIGNISLTEDLKQDYLTEPDLREVLDKISDMMIINNLSEDFIRNFKPRAFDQNGSGRKHGTYNNRLGKVLNVNNLEQMKKYIHDFVIYFNNNVEVDNFLSVISSDYTLFEDISKFASEMLKGDYYEALKIRDRLEETYKKELRLMAQSDIYRFIPGFLMNRLPRIELGSKYDFYFGDAEFEEGFNDGKELTDEQKDKILSIYETKKVPLNKFEGKTFDEIRKNYSETENFNFAEIKQFPELFKLTSTYLVHLTCMKVLDNSEVFDDFLVYSLGRDIMFSMVDLPLDEICKRLQLNQISCQLFQESDYELGDLKLDLSKFIKYILFNDPQVSGLYESEMSVDDLRKEMGASEDSMLGEVEGLEVPTRIVKAFFEQ